MVEALICASGCLGLQALNCAFCSSHWWIASCSPGLHAHWASTWPLSHDTKRAPVRVTRVPQCTAALAHNVCVCCSPCDTAGLGTPPNLAAAHQRLLCARCAVTRHLLIHQQLRPNNSCEGFSM